MSNVKAKFTINMHCIQIQRSVRPEALFQMIFSRNANVLPSQKKQANDQGYVKINELVEMSTTVEWDEETKDYKPKLSKLEVFCDGVLMGHAQINLAEYVSPNRKTLHFALFPSGLETGPLETKPLSNATEEYMSLEISTGQKKPSGNAADRVSSRKTSVQQSGESTNLGQPKNSRINQLQNTVDKFTSEISDQQHKNESIKAELKKLGYDLDQLSVSASQSSEKQRGTIVARGSEFKSSFMLPSKRDNTAKYKQLKGVTDDMVQQLVKLDQDTDKLFDTLMKKRSMNEEMIGNKIESLNEKPSLRNYLFKKVSNDQLQRDLSEIENEVILSYKII